MPRSPVDVCQNRVCLHDCFAQTVAHLTFATSVPLPPLSVPVSTMSCAPLTPVSLPPSSPSPPPTITINISSSPSGLHVSQLPTTANPSVSAGFSPEPAPAIPSSPPISISSTPPFTNDHISGLQLEKWKDLVLAYPESRLRQHSWEWRAEDWLPHYLYPEVTSITTIWEEWANGLDGYLSTRQLEERWGAKWRRNLPTLKTPHARRKKVVRLVQELSNRHRWDTKLALRFLREKYEPHFSARKFCEYLQKKGGTGWEDVVSAAGGYT